MSKGNHKKRPAPLRKRVREAGEIRFRLSEGEKANAVANMTSDKFTDLNAWSRWKLCQPRSK